MQHVRLQRMENSYCWGYKAMKGLLQEITNTFGDYKPTHIPHSGTNVTWVRVCWWVPHLCTNGKRISDVLGEGMILDNVD